MNSAAVIAIGASYDVRIEHRKAEGSNIGLLSDVDKHDAVHDRSSGGTVSHTARLTCAARVASKVLQSGVGRVALRNPCDDTIRMSE